MDWPRAGRKNQDQSPFRVAVIGGGITGLGAAHRLVELCREAELPLSITLLESGERPGGAVFGERVNGFLLESGPDTLVVRNDGILSLCRRLGLGDDLIRLDGNGRKVHVVHKGRLTPLPRGFMMMAPTRLWPTLFSPLFSWRGKLRIASERFIPPRVNAEEDEDLRSFVMRRFGAEVLERAAQPLLSGIYITDADCLSMKLTMPQFLRLEQHYGSVIHGLRSHLKNNGSGRGGSGFHGQRMFSIRGGLGRIIDHLVLRLPRGSLNTQTRVERIEHDYGEYSWRIHSGSAEDLICDAVIMACPAFEAARILRETSTSLSDDLERLPYGSCATVNLVYEKSALRKPIDSHGFFVPRSEHSPLLACSFVSSKFSDRVPDNYILLRTYIGGNGFSSWLDLDDQTLARKIHGELKKYLQVEREPVFHLCYRHQRSMPQYPVGFSNQIEVIRRRAFQLPGLFIAGSAVGAVGLPSCIESGEQAAQQAAEYGSRLREALLV